MALIYVNKLGGGIFDLNLRKIMYYTKSHLSTYEKLFQGDSISGDGGSSYRV